MILPRAALVPLAFALAPGLPAQQTQSRPTSPPAQTRPQDIPIPLDFEGGVPIDLKLEDALRLGRRNNTALRSAELLPLLAQQDLRFARAFFEPELYAEAGASETKDPTFNVFRPATTRDVYDGKIGWRHRVVTGGLFDLALAPTKVDQTASIAGFPSRQYTNDITLSLTQPLLRGAWSDYALSGVRTGESSLAAAQQRFHRAVQVTLFEIVKAYWELVFARENWRVVYASLELAKEQLRITNERIRVRELAERDRVADEADVARRQEELIAAENLIRAREDGLRRLLFDDRDGLLWRRNLRPTTPIPESPDVTDVDWRGPAETALRTRPDLHALRADVAVAETQVTVAERDVLPRLDLVGSYGTDGTRDHFDDAWGDSLGRDYADWSVRLQLSVPIGNQAALATREKARLVLEQSKRALYSAEMDVARDVRDAVRELKAFALRTRASQESVRLADTNLDTERQKLRVGLSTVFEVQRRNQELREARGRLLRNQLDYRIAQALMLHAQGLLEARDEAPR